MISNIQRGLELWCKAKVSGAWLVYSTCAPFTNFDLLLESVVYDHSLPPLTSRRYLLVNAPRWVGYWPLTLIWTKWVATKKRIGLWTLISSDPRRYSFVPRDADEGSFSIWREKIIRPAMKSNHFLCESNSSQGYHVGHIHSLWNGIEENRFHFEVSESFQVLPLNEKVSGPENTEISLFERKKEFLRSAWPNWSVPPRNETCSINDLTRTCAKFS